MSFANPSRGTAVLLVLAALAQGHHLAAQTISGTVHDDATSAPLPGAFLEVVDVHGGRVAAALSDSAGRFRFEVEIGRSTLRGEAVGYADAAASFELAPGEERALELRLRPVRLVLPGPGAEPPGACPSPSDTTGPVAAALGEARKSLRLADWSMREAGLALATRRYVRISGASPQLDPDAVWVDTVYGQLPYSPAELVPEGGKGQVRAARIQPPGIDALLSDAFVRAHCFSFRRKEGRIGLAFSPVRPGADAGIRGTFWLEPDGAVRQIDFTLASVTGPFRIRHPGGSVELARTPGGYTIVRRWVTRAAIRGMVTEAGGEVIRSWVGEP